MRFLSIAHGSLRELETHLVIARDLELLSEADAARALEMIATTSRNLTRLVRSLRA